MPTRLRQARCLAAIAPFKDMLGRMLNVQRNSRLSLVFIELVATEKIVVEREGALHM